MLALENSAFTDWLVEPGSSNVTPSLVSTFVGDGWASHLLVCSRTRTAVIIDPLPRSEVYEATINAHRLRVRFIFNTGAAAKTVVAYSDLLQSLGLHDAEPDPEPEEAGTVPRITPVGRSPSDATATVQAGGTLVQVRYVPESSNRRLTVGAPYDLAVQEFPFDHLRIAFGVGHVQVLPLREWPGRVAYLVGDRLFTGLEPATGNANAKVALPVAFAKLSDDVLVYGRTTKNGVAVTTLGQERAFTNRGGRR